MTRALGAAASVAVALSLTIGLTPALAASTSARSAAARERLRHLARANDLRVGPRPAWVNPGC